MIQRFFATADENEPMRSLTGKEALAAGIFLLAVAGSTTVFQCSFHTSAVRPMLTAYLELMCPAGRLDAQPHVPLWYGLLNKVWALWLLGLILTCWGAAKLWRPDPRNASLDTLLKPAQMASAGPTCLNNVAESVSASDAGERKIFGRRSAPMERAKDLREERAAVLERQGKQVSARLQASMPPDELARVEAAELEAKNFQSFAARIDALLARADVEAALTLAEDQVRNSGWQAASGLRNAEIDWVGISAEAIEADARLKQSGAGGCDEIQLEIGNLSDDCLNIYRICTGQAPDDRGSGNGAQPRRRGASYGWTSDVMAAEGLHQITEMQRNRTGYKMAGYLRVLAIFYAVQRHALGDGLPFPVRLNVSVQSICGDQAMYQLGPSLQTEIDVAVKDIDSRVLVRLQDRYRRHVEKWNADTERLIAYIEEHFFEKSYVPSRMIPDEASELKSYFRGLEDRLVHVNPENLLSTDQLYDVLDQIRTVRDAQIPTPVPALTQQ